MSMYEIVGVFQDRDQLEKAMEALEGKGVDRAQMSLLGTKEAVEAKLGVPMRDVPGKDPGAAADPDAPTQEPIKRDETGSLTGMMTVMPAYVAATLAAGVTVASGGALAGAAIAAVAGAAAGGAVGGTAGKIFNDSIDAAYEEQIKAGGIVLIVSLKDPGEAEPTKAVLREHAAQQVEMQVDTGQ